MPIVSLTDTMDNTADLIFACFFGALVFMALVGLVYIIVDDTIRFKKRRERMKETAEQSGEKQQER